MYIWSQEIKVKNSVLPKFETLLTITATEFTEDQTRSTIEQL